MRYKVMRLMCMFDLPMQREGERKSYTKFRKNLIKEGFIMVQYSVYMRVCPSRDHATRMIKRIEKIVPKDGHIRIFMITEKQYKDMKIIIGEKSKTENVLGTNRFISL